MSKSFYYKQIFYVKNLSEDIVARLRSYSYPKYTKEVEILFAKNVLHK